MEFSLDLVRGDVKQSAATSGAAIPVASKGNALLKELLNRGTRHVWLVVGVEVTGNEDTTGSAGGVLSFGLETSLVYGEDLEALIRVPPRANHTGTQTVPVVVDDLAHDASGGSDRREVTHLSCLNINVVPHILRDR